MKESLCNVWHSGLAVNVFRKLQPRSLHGSCPKSFITNGNHLQENYSDATKGWQGIRVCIACEVMS